ncbi:MAG: SDR family NAD(P)-dependent oxidoreductase, partial [Candidatus Aminicenantes bacterium]
PIGKPMQNTRLYILDKDDLLQPIGIPGELCIGGVGLARGYLNNPDLTTEKFRRKNFLLKGTRGLAPLLYQTGDLARWLPDGNVEFLGRKDHQVKIRGFRIELEEIENCLLSHEDIKEAVVLAKENAEEETHLCAYIVSAKEPTALVLRDYLSKKLPAYMIPAHFVRVEKIPLTPGGKVNRQALLSSGTVLQTGKEYVSPGTDIERTIAEIWQELLQVDRVSIHDNFFDVGGNSFSLIRLSSRLKGVFKKDIPVVTLFNYPTIGSLARYLSGETGERTGVRQETGKAGIEIAVIGMAGRFPGAKTIDEFLANLKNGTESITYLTGEELEQMGVEEELAKNPAFITAKGRLQDIEYFDSLFFGYTPGEAAIMDPQMRIFHECCWEALENAGYAGEMYDRDIGLYAGASPNPFWEIMPLKPVPGKEHLNTQQWEAIQFSDKDYLTTRIAYKLNLTGPGVTLQTACSTSLSAVILACQGLVSGACDMALAGGVSVTLYDHAGYFYQEGVIMSRDGHCRAFDAKATGTVGGNGAGVVVLKRLEEAASARDTIYAVIKGFAINNDGKNKAGFTAPGVEGQVRVIQKAQRMAGVDPESIGYVETHGTGTLLGDPIEIEALKQAFNFKSSNNRNYCALGSVKTNIGHLDAAAGIAGFIKTVLALLHRIIPPALHFETPNPAIDFENSPFYVNTALKEWKSNGYPLRAGVSSFGIGGTNAHVILEEPLKGTRGLAPLLAPLTFSEYQLILLSAKTPIALDKMTENLAEYFKKNLLNRGNHENPTHPGPTLADAAYTLQVGRKAFPHRKMLVYSEVNEAAAALLSQDSRKVHTGFVKEGKRTIVFVLSGLGSQYVNMGLGLYQTEPVFREEMDRCFEILTPLLGCDSKEILYPSLSVSSVSSVSSVAKNRINHTEIAQPLLFIFEYALSKLLMKWGIKPHAMIGYSFGEYTAACLSGVFSLEDALKTVVLRGQLIEQMPPGAMLSVPLPREDVQLLLNDNPQGVALSLAIDNGPSCIVSGPVHDIDAFEKRMKEKKYVCVRLSGSHALHSHMMTPVLKTFAEHLRELSLSKPQIPYISNVTGKVITPGEAVDPAYWARHLRNTVRFADGIKELLKKSNPIFVEIGPGHDLSVLLRHHIDKKHASQPIIVNLVRHSQSHVPDHRYLLNKIGRLWLSGIDIDWREWNPNEKRYRIPLPTYPFASQRYWIDNHPLKMAGQFSTKKSLEKRLDIGDWFYIPSWKRSVLNFAPSAAPSGKFCWLVFMDESGLGSQLVKRLEQEGEDVVIIMKGTGFTRISYREYTINPLQSDDYHALISELCSLNRLPHRVVHFWLVTKEKKEPPQVQDTETGFYSLLYFAQAVGKQGTRDQVQIQVISNGLQKVTGAEELCPEKATALGAIHVIPQEYTNIHCRSIDIVRPALENDESNRLIHQLLLEFSIDSPDTIVAYRDDYRWVQIFEPVRLEEPEGKTPLLKEQGIYLITGGLGGIGFVLAEHLAKKVQAKLVLTGRSTFPGKKEWEQWLKTHKQDDTLCRKIKQVKRLEELGAEVLTCRADVSNPEQMQQVIALATERFGRIDGVIHSAGLPDGGVIPLRTRETIDPVLLPKVKGTLVLDRLLKNVKHDFFIICSSITSIAGQFGQVAYCAANSFLDTFACYKSSRDGIYTLSINWDIWQEVGMGVETVKQLIERENITDAEELLANGILPTEGTDVFDRVLRCRYPQVLVSTRDLISVLEWRKMAESSAPEQGREFEEYTGTLYQRPELSTE